MAGGWTSERFPQFEKQIRSLVKKHGELEDEPLHLAIAYQPGPPREQQDIYLIEVIGGWGDSNPDKELFETTFEPNSRLQTGFDRRLHMILTTPVELKKAIEEKRNTAEEIIDAMRRGEYCVLHADKTGGEIVDWIGQTERTREVASIE